jgi:hypothetical protein
MVNHKQKRTRKVSRKVMRGGVGYKFNNKDVIGGRPRVERYSECPSASPNSKEYGLAMYDLKGGRRRSSRRNSKRSSRRNSKRSSRRNSKRSSRRNRRRSQRGGGNNILNLGLNRFLKSTGLV